MLTAGVAPGQALPWFKQTKIKIKGEKERGSRCAGDGRPLRVTGTAQAVKLTAEMPPWGEGPGRWG